MCDSGPYASQHFCFDDPALTATEVDTDVLSKQLRQSEGSIWSEIPDYVPVTVEPERGLLLVAKDYADFELFFSMNVLQECMDTQIAYANTMRTQ